MSDWYARRLAARQQQQGAPPTQGRPSPGSAGYPQAPTNRQWVPQQPQSYTNATATAVQVPREKVTVDNLWGAMQAWRGGKAHKVDAEPCPECGSPNYYSRTDGGAKRGPPPAPHCFSCGYNGGLFHQGDPGTWNGQ